MEPQLKRKRRAEEEEKTGNPVKVKMGNNEEKRRKEEKVDNQAENEEGNLAELDNFAMLAMLAGVPFLKTKIKLFAKKRESWLKEKVDELEKVLALKKRHLVEFESINRELRQKLARVYEDFNAEKRKSQEIKEDAKARELKAKTEVAQKNRMIEKLNIENHNLKNNFERESAFTRRQILVTSELTEKLKVDKHIFEKKLESANVTIEKNLEKIAKLEARNLGLENDKSGQLQLGTRIAKLEQQESEMFENFSQDQSVKVEYQETVGKSQVKSEISLSDMQIQSGSDMQIQSGSDIQIQTWICKFCDKKFEGQPWKLWKNHLGKCKKRYKKDKNKN